MYRNSDDLSLGMLQWRIDVPVHRTASPRPLSPDSTIDCMRTPHIVSRSSALVFGHISQTRSSDRKTASGVRLFIPDDQPNRFDFLSAEAGRTDL